jgi:alpha,alpha-trehalase
LNSKNNSVEYLFTQWKRLEGALKDKKVFLVLDYDGTLTPIRAKPELATLSDRTRAVLATLAGKPAVTVAVISGRPLHDIRKLIGLKRVIYAGNHGLELAGPGMKYTNRAALSSQRLLDRIYAVLQKECRMLKGVRVEHKGLTLSIHFRLASVRDRRQLNAALDRALNPLVAIKKVRLTHGKKVYEIRPAVDWDKGAIVRWLLKRCRISRSRSAVVCVGDDTTDEDMFAVLGRSGITIAVGSSRSSRARYYVKNTREVVTLLHRVARII